MVDQNSHAESYPNMYNIWLFSYLELVMPNYNVVILLLRRDLSRLVSTCESNNPDQTLTSGLREKKKKSRKFLLPISFHLSIVIYSYNHLVFGTINLESKYHYSDIMSTTFYCHEKQKKFLLYSNKSSYCLTIAI